jgi:hypothetical protein
MTFNTNVIYDNNKTNNKDNNNYENLRRLITPSIVAYSDHNNRINGVDVR